MAMQDSHNGAVQQSRPKNGDKPKIGTGLPGPGRPKGQPNRVTQTIKDAIEMAARDCHPHGLAGWLVERAQGGVQDRQMFVQLIGRVVPLQVNQNVNGGISINLNWLGGRAIGTVAAQPKVIDAQTVELIEDSPTSNWTSHGMQQAAGVPGAGRGQEPEAVGALEQGGGYPAPDQQATTQPAPDTQAGGASPSGTDPDPPSPHRSAGGGPAEAGAPSPPLAS